MNADIAYQRDVKLAKGCETKSAVDDTEWSKQRLVVKP